MNMIYLHTVTLTNKDDHYAIYIYVCIHFYICIFIYIYLV